MKKKPEPRFSKLYPNIASISTPNCDDAIVGLAIDHALHCSRLVYNKWTLYNILGRDAERYCNVVNKSIRDSAKRKLQPPLILTYDAKTLRDLLKLRTIFPDLIKKKPEPRAKPCRATRNKPSKKHRRS
jgi:wobble nucleotide-excising tRNase